MKITCLGHGGAFADADVGNSAFLIEEGPHKILLDCGSTVPTVLREMDVDPGSLTAIVISHLHAGHVGGLERLLYHRKFISKVGPLNLVMGTVTMSDWKAIQDLAGNGLYDGFNTVNCIPVEPGTPIVLGTSQLSPAISAYRAYHADPNSYPGPDNPLCCMACYSFLIEIAGKTVFFSGDRIWYDVEEGLKSPHQAMFKADLILHEIELFDSPSGVHTHYSDLPEVLKGRENVVFHHHGLTGYGDVLPEWGVMSHQFAMKGKVYNVPSIKF